MSRCRNRFTIADTLAYRMTNDKSPAPIVGLHQNSNTALMADTSPVFSNSRPLRWVRASVMPMPSFAEFLRDCDRLRAQRLQNGIRRRAGDHDDAAATRQIGRQPVGQHLAHKNARTGQRSRRRSMRTSYRDRGSRPPNTRPVRQTQQERRFYRGQQLADRIDIYAHHTSRRLRSPAIVPMAQVVTTKCHASCVASACGRSPISITVAASVATTAIHQICTTRRRESRAGLRRSCRHTTRSA